MIKVEKIIPGGQALGTHPDGRKIFFWNALPGETVTDYEITKKKTHYLEAIAKKISHPSKIRITPKDSCFISTSPWQIIDYPQELKLKQSLIVEIFREQHIKINLPEIITDQQDFFYRNKMEYALYWSHSSHQIELAFRKRGTHRKVPIDTSSIERPEIFQHAQKIIAELNARHEEARKYQSLLIRCNQQGEVSGGLYQNHQPHPQFPPLKDKILGRTYTYSLNGFFQINLPVYEMALREIQKNITTDSVLDLYAGVGTIGLSVALDRNLTLVEVDKAAFAELQKNVAQSSLSNILPIFAKSEEVLKFIKPDQTVILDPPRAGCARKLIDHLTKTKPEKIIYLSCNPATQSRDIKFLLNFYHIDNIKTFNFFPRTPHIENLVVLSRKI